jgi:hypothetical protein
MAGPKIKGGHVGSIASLKKRLKKGSGGQYLSRVPGDGALTVRFLTEPDEWIEYFEHFDQMRKFYPCTDNCPGCLEGDKPSKRYLSNAVDTQENKVIPLVLPASAASSLVKKYDKYATLLDRDYEIARSGTGFDTEYEVTPEPPTKMNLNRFDALDLMALLGAQLEDEDEDADDDDKPAKAAAKPKPGRRKAAPVADDDEEDEDEAAEDDEDTDTEDESDDADADDEDDVYSEEALNDMSPAEVKAVMKEAGWTLADLRGKSKDDMIEEYLAEFGGDAAADDDGDDEDPEDDEDDDTADGDDDADEDEEELDEDALLAMDLPDLKALAKEYGVKIARGAKQADIVAAILDQAGEEDDED